MILLADPGTYQQILELHALLYLFKSDCNKQQIMGGVFFGFHKSKDFFHLL